MTLDYQSLVRLAPHCESAGETRSTSAGVGALAARSPQTQPTPRPR